MKIFELFGWRDNSYRPRILVLEWVGSVSTTCTDCTALGFWQNLMPYYSICKREKFVCKFLPDKLVRVTNLESNSLLKYGSRFLKFLKWHLRTLCMAGKFKLNCKQNLSKMLYIYHPLKYDNTDFSRPVCS